MEHVIGSTVVTSGPHFSKNGAAACAGSSGWARRLGEPLRRLIGKMTVRQPILVGNQPSVDLGRTGGEGCRPVEIPLGFWDDSTLTHLL